MVARNTLPDRVFGKRSTTTTILKGPVQKAKQNVAYLSIVESVKIKKITVDKFKFMESLNFLGSNLGLWPGLGIFQLVEGGIGLVLALSFENKLKVFIHKRIL